MANTSNNSNGTHQHSKLFSFFQPSPTHYNTISDDELDQTFGSGSEYVSLRERRELSPTIDQNSSSSALIQSAMAGSPTIVTALSPHNRSNSIIEASVALLTPILRNDAGRKSGVPPETDFLFSLMHCSTLEDAQDMARHRYEYLRHNDDAAKLHRTPFYRVALYRLPAICLTLFLEVIVGLVISKYSTVLERHILLTSFMPILSSISGNIGLQSSTSTLRALATGHASNAQVTDVLKVVVKELASAVCVAVLAGIALATLGGLWAHTWRFAAVTGTSIFIGASLAGVNGSLAPLIFKAFGIDPAVTAGTYYLPM
ncbi:hypothetical protein SmJEL517_g03687 [Synchytrium microbalum]|uniref:SLC41A/MgtE integral membrane domain-containing protein n=1 Tax=Synchytrium microbalum TaxID=1806994 RepID=A0A507C796_9FUNG|nr:uncharacterized protein SmJEL517_g03687 [Synchytrium microbalum]TPX33403.1 hypothetical protein SmJEL517_g03687 [Synchytrium microbalum]